MERQINLTEQKGETDLSVVLAIIVSALWRKRLRLAISAGAGVLLAIGIAFLIPRRYESKVQLMPPGWQGNNTVLMGSLSGRSIEAQSAGFAALEGHSQAGPLLGIINSETAHDDLIKRFNLEQAYHVHNLDSARKYLSRETNAFEDKSTGIIVIVVSDRDPLQARNIAAGYVDELNKLVVLMDTSEAHRERVFLESRVEQLQLDVHDAEVALSNFSNRTGTIDATAQSRVMLDATSRLQGELITAQSELQGLRAMYAETNVRVQAAKAKVTALEDQLAKVSGTNVQHGSSSGLPFPSLRALPAFGVTYSELYRRSHELSAELDMFTRELEVAKVNEAEEIPSVKVLDPPLVPESSSFPPRMLIVISGLILSMIVSIGSVSLAEVLRLMDDSHPIKNLFKNLR